MTKQSEHRLPPVWNFIAAASLALLILVLVVSAGVHPGFAQSQGEEWSEPVNLSRSGGTDAPRLFFDSQNIGHVFWLDTFEGPMYVRSEPDGTWTDPVALELPFSANLGSARFTTDGAGGVHAFWLENTGTSNLQYTAVEEARLSDPAAWSTPISLGEQVAVFDVQMDEAAGIHLLYHLSRGADEDPAGVYYLAAAAPDYTFGTPVLLADSRYLRGVTTEDSNVSLSASAGTLHAAWDVRALNQVYFSRSIDGGVTWDGPEIIDARGDQDSFDAQGPNNIRLAVSGEQVFRFWQAGHGEETCSLYVQVSPDVGENWSERMNLSEDISGCPSEIRILRSTSGEVILMTVRQIGVLFQGWEGGQWSTPQLQMPVTTFLHPETFREVDFNCRQPAFDRENTLYMIGCDTGEGEDIWLVSRSLDAIRDWFPTPTPTVPWSSPFAVVVSAGELANPLLTADGNGRLHAFWTSGGNTVRYARWEGEGSGAGLAWSSPIDVETIAGGRVHEPAALVSPAGRLYLTWSWGPAGGIGFTSSDPGEAIFPGEWADRMQLPAPRAGATSPDLALDVFDTLYVVYAVPLNEARGIYLVRSSDGGETWSDPAFVMDAEAAGWEMVDHPALAVTGDGKIHVAMTRYAVGAAEGATPLSLVYRVSGDRGQTWSEEQIVTTRPVVGSQLLAIGGNSLMRAWTDLSSERLSLWYQVSYDSGVSWTDARRVSEYGTETPYFSLTLDQAGVPHILQIRSEVISESAVSSMVLQHSIWDGFNWQLVENVELGPVDVTALASAIGARGSLGALYVLGGDPELTGNSANNLVFSYRPLDLDIALPTPVPTGTPAPGTLLQLTPSPEPTLTPTIAFSRQIREPGLLAPLGSFSGLVVGLAPVVLLLAVVFVMIRKKQPDR